MQVFAVPGLPEITAGHDLPTLIGDALAAGEHSLLDGDIVVVASKVVAKAEGRTVPEPERDAWISAESTHEVAARTLADGRSTRVVHTRQGPVLAAAGVDASDVPGGTVLLLPADPDASARRLRTVLAERFGAQIGVLVTDTSGRPWRSGVTDFCLGAAGVTVLDDRRGTPDAAGRVLSVTVRNVADEISAAADLVKGKSAGTPVAIVRGLDGAVSVEDGPGARGLTRTGVTDWFQYGHVEAVRRALERPGNAVEVGAPFIDPFAEEVSTRLARAVRVALACPGAEEVTADVGAHIELSGDAFGVGRVLERLLAAAWAEDLDLTEPAASAASAVNVKVTLTVRDNRVG